MTQEQIVLEEIRSAIASMAPSDKETVEVAAVALRTLITHTFPAGHGRMALALVGAELAAE